MNETILGLLKNKTIILATHAMQYVKSSDYIYLMDKGEIKIEGKFEKISESSLYKKFIQIQDWKKERVDKETNEEEKDSYEIDEKIPIFPNPLKSRKKSSSFVEELDKPEVEQLVLELNISEDRKFGAVSWQVFKTFIKEIGGITTILIPFTLHTIRQILLMASLNFLQEWSYRYDPSNKLNDYKTYGVYQLSGCFLEFISRIFFIWVGYRVSLKLHNKMVYRVMHSKIEEFLNRIPSGRLMNRFSKDVSQIDQNMTEEMSYMMYLFSRVLVTLGTIGFALGYEISILVVIMVIVSIIYQQRYQKTRREYKRLESISRSPVLNISSDTIRGLSCIRIMGLVNFMRSKFEHNINENGKNQLTCNILRNWFELRLGMTSILSIHLPCFLLMLFYFKDLTVPKAGLFLVSVFTLVETMEELINQISEVEISMIAVERCQAFQELDVEDQYTDFEEQLDKIVNKGGSNPIKAIKKFKERKNSELIIKQGEIKFINFSARYKTSSKPVLKNLDFFIKSGEKIGIVGRTGSGKSSLIKSIWRCLDGISGCICIDGADISKVDLKTLRSQMMIVTQQTALFEGTLRDNLDPSSSFELNDEKLIEILKELKFKHKGFKTQKLDMRIDSNGSNLSEGEKQLICFARCLIHIPKLIILDEATASIDIKTEELFQKSIEKYFAESTVLIIAHRVQTVMDCDRILVLKNGEVEAFDKPSTLLKEDSFFKRIVEKMNSEEKNLKEKKPDLEQ